MPTDPLIIDPADPNLMNAVRSLSTTPGYCIFIDIVGSTAMKQRDIHEWVALIHNCFANSTMFLNVFRPLKSIGDELMFFIEDRDLATTGETPLQIYDGLYQVATDMSSAFPPTKIVAAYCTSVYPMTFIRGTRDYYGIDVDRAARLKSIKPRPRERELVIDSEMYLRVKSHYDASGNQHQFSSFLALKGPAEHHAKGIPQPLQVYRTVVKEHKCKIWQKVF